MHIHKCYSRSSSCDYYDTTSALAVEVMTDIHNLLTHVFELLMTMDFSSIDILLDVIILMVLLEWLCVNFTPLHPLYWRIISILPLL